MLKDEEAPYYSEDSSSDEEVDTSVKVIVVVFGKTS